MTYPLAFRQKVLAIKEANNLTYDAAAKRFDISKNSLVLWKRKLEPKKTKNRPWIKIQKQDLEDDVNNNPDLYQYERAIKFGVSTSCIQLALKRLRLSVKKRHSDILAPVPKNRNPI